MLSHAMWRRAVRMCWLAVEMKRGRGHVHGSVRRVVHLRERGASGHLRMRGNLLRCKHRRAGNTCSRKRGERLVNAAEPIQPVAQDLGEGWPVPAPRRGRRKT